MVSRRQFLGTLALATSNILFTGQPRLAALVTTSGSHQRQAQALCTEDVPALLNLVATIEALSTTFYYTAMTTADGFFAALPTKYQRYLRASLDADWFHYHYLTSQKSATPVTTTFYFAKNSFAAGHFADFLGILDQLETIAIAATLATLHRLSTLNEPVLAEIIGQMSAIEAEHRVVGRELAQVAPPPPNNLCFQPATFFCVAEAQARLAPFLNGGSNTVAYPLPDQTAITAAIGQDGVDQTIAPATNASCQETVADILNSAAIAEAIGITFYYGGIQAGFFAQLSQPQQWYLQAALDEERHHLDFLRQNGAAVPPAAFFFPANVFVDLSAFLTLLDTLENLFIGTYLAAIQRFAQVGEFLLAEIAGQILGVEAEHRVLGRVISGATLPNNLGLARASFTCVTEVVAALQPFIEGNTQFTEQKPMPTLAEINSAVDRFGCTPVATATAPSMIYLPLLTK